MFKNIIENTINNNFNVRDEYKHLSVDDLKQIQSETTLPLRVCAVNIEGDLNVGMMARTAALIGVEKFYIFGRRRFDRRSLVGAQNYLPIERVDGLDESGNIDHDKFLKFCDQEQLIPILFEHGGTLLGKLSWNTLFNDAKKVNKTLCLVFGNESSGFPENFRSVHTTVSIYQTGVLRSFNVSAAAAIAMWDCSKSLLESPLDK